MKQEVISENAKFIKKLKYIKNILKLLKMDKVGNIDYDYILSTETILSDEKRGLSTESQRHLNRLFDFYQNATIIISVITSLALIGGGIILGAVSQSNFKDSGNMRQSPDIPKTPSFKTTKPQTEPKLTTDLLTKNFAQVGINTVNVTIS